ncbi:hypothetical protein LXA47_23620 [Massilia sp. P8910]|uniref:hypothetical protein n=1 Tax=Massilia antarctica TaxID=2765360 RepID=UPI001E414E80|nr:hypothetical protein [Massilia antarctica]MCE3606569.1 hypothetical protein [Massilia antarctica]
MTDYQFWDLILKAVASILAVGGATAGIAKYFRSVEGTFRAPLWEKQLNLYFEVCEVAATLAAEDNLVERTLAERRFWRLYYGPLALVESPEVEQAMVEFALAIEKNPHDLKILRSLALGLAYQCRESIAKSWRTTLPELSAKAIHPTSRARSVPNSVR